LSPRVILHIGSTKTGSSALQATLYERREGLAAAGVHYSDHGVRAGAHHLLAAGIHPSAWHIHKDAMPDERADREALFVEMARQIMADAAAAGQDTIVISSEYFWEAFPSHVYKTFRTGFKGARFEVVAFVRQPAEWVVSSYMQALKYGEARDFAEWFAHWKTRWASGIHYFRVVNRWNYFLEAERIHLLRYADTKTNVMKAFCDTLELSGESLDTSAPERVVNPSPTFESVARILEINRSDLGDGEKQAERRKVMRTQAPSRRALDLLDGPHAEEIVKLTHASVRLLERMFVQDGAPLFPAYDPPSPAPQSVPDPA